MIVHQTHNSLGNYSYNAFFYDDCQWFYHFHKNPELIYVLDGSVEMTLGTRKLPLSAGTFALILPNQFHAYQTPTHSRVWIGVFSADFVDEFVRLIQGRYAADPRFRCSEAIQSYLQLLLTEEPPALLPMKSLLYAVCGEFLRQVHLTDADREQDFVWQVHRYVADHFQEALTFSHLAEALGYEYHYLSRQFRHHFGMHFRQFLNTYRLDYARERLLYAPDSITQVAFAAGFQTVRTFNRAFAQHTGMTPSQFRRTHPRLHRQKQNSDGSFFYADDLP